MVFFLKKIGDAGCKCAPDGSCRDEEFVECRETRVCLPNFLILVRNQIYNTVFICF